MKVTAKAYSRSAEVKSFWAIAKLALIKVLVTLPIDRPILPGRCFLQFVGKFGQALDRLGCWRA